MLRHVVMYLHNNIRKKEKDASIHKRKDKLTYVETDRSTGKKKKKQTDAAFSRTQSDD